MPIYEYICNVCEEDFSVIQGISVLPKDTKCPKCGSNDVKKTVSAFSCLFGNDSKAKSSELISGAST